MICFGLLFRRYEHLISLWFLWSLLTPRTTYMQYTANDMREKKKNKNIENCLFDMYVCIYSHLPYIEWIWLSRGASSRVECVCHIATACASGTFTKLLNLLITAHEICIFHHLFLFCSFISCSSLLIWFGSLAAAQCMRCHLYLHSKSVYSHFVVWCVCHILWICGIEHNLIN